MSGKPILGQPPCPDCTRNEPSAFLNSLGESAVFHSYFLSLTNGSYVRLSPTVAALWAGLVKPEIRKSEQKL